MEEFDVKLNAIIEVLNRYGQVLKVMSNGVGHAMALALHNCEKCSQENCDSAATWKSLSDYHSYCDRHRALLITKEASKEEDWDEFDNSESIRSIQEFIELKEKLGYIVTMH